MAAGSPDDEPSKLLKSVVTDTGRHFFDAPAGMGIEACLLRLQTLEGAEVVSLMPAEIGQWLSFRCDGHDFAASDPLGEVWFYADDPGTPEAILQKIALWMVAPINPS